MDDRRKNKEGTVNHEFSVQVQIIEKRKLRSKSRGRKHIWFGLGMFGMVGWAVTLPTLLGVLLGVWIDFGNPGRYSWTLMLLLAGLIAGCANAWFWLRKEREAIFREREEDDE